MTRNEPATTADYRKDPIEERFLDDLNTALSTFEEAQYRELELSAPLLYVMGVPRSGTTLLSQLLAFHLEVAYIDHLAAAFWRAPVTGLRLSAKLLQRPTTSSFRSQFGRTDGIHEPHEFGYFWSDLLAYPELAEQGEDHEDRIDWQRFRRVLTNMSQAAGGVLLFKPFLLTWHLKRALQVLPETLVVRVERDRIDNTLSLLRFRQRFLGSSEAWASLKPRAYAWLRERPVAQQLAGQVHFLDEALTSQLREIPERNRLTVSYEDLCAAPGPVIERIREALARLGTTVDPRGMPPMAFELQRPRDQAEAALVIDLEQAFATVTAVTP